MYIDGYIGATKYLKKNKNVRFKIVKIANYTLRQVSVSSVMPKTL